MPVGTDDPDVYLAWILDSLGLVRRRGQGDSVEDSRGALHRLMRDQFFAEPRKGWDSRALQEASGLSSTALHHQLVKLRTAGLLSIKTEGGWKRHFVRNGSLPNMIELISGQARTILKQRLDVLNDHIIESDERMVLDPLQHGTEDLPFRITIAESGPEEPGDDDLHHLMQDFGYTGSKGRIDDDLASRIFEILSTSLRPITTDHIMEKTHETRTRVLGILDRFRASHMVERVLLSDRIPHDVFVGLTHQWTSRGDRWLMGRGGLGRLEDSVSDQIIEALKHDSLTTELVETNLAEVSLEAQCLLVNTLGGRVPYGYRMAGKDGIAVKRRIEDRVDRLLRRLEMVSDTLDELM